MIQIPLQSTHIFDFSLQAHEKTTIHSIQLIGNNDENVLWKLNPCRTAHHIVSRVDNQCGYFGNTTIRTGHFEQEIEIVSNREDWNIVLQIEGILP